MPPQTGLMILAADILAACHILLSTLALLILALPATTLALLASQPAIAPRPHRLEKLPFDQNLFQTIQVSLQLEPLVSKRLALASLVAERGAGPSACVPTPLVPL